MCRYLAELRHKTMDNHDLDTYNSFLEKTVREEEKEFFTDPYALDENASVSPGEEVEG